MISIVELSTADTYALRRAVLRDGDPDRSVSFAEDEWSGAYHLGGRDADGEIVAISTWIPNACPLFPRRPAMQLRGMATAAAAQGQGFGGALLEAGIARATGAGAEIAWARARDAALRFYERHDCQVVGDGFIDDTTGLPHHLVIREIVVQTNGAGQIL